MSGQGRVLAQLLKGAGSGKAVVFSEAAPKPTLTDDTSIRLTPAGRSFAASIRNRADEIAAGAARTDCAVLVGCSGSPYDLTATALAARSLKLPFLAYLFDDPIFQWPTRRLRGAAARLSSVWLPLAEAVIVPNEYLGEDWRQRGAASIAIVRNAAAEVKSRSKEQTASLLGSAAGLPVIYTGSVYHAQADAFRGLLSALGETDNQFHLHIFTSQAPSTVADYGIFGPYVTRHDPVPATELPALLSAAAVLFLPLGFDTGVPEVIRTAAPAKLGDYLQSGSPVLAHVPADSFVAHFCRKHTCALVVGEPSVGALASGLRLLARRGPSVARMMENAKLAAIQFSAEESRREFWSIVRRTVAGGRNCSASAGFTVSSGLRRG
jgi:hypothetical protein